MTDNLSPVTAGERPNHRSAGTVMGLVLGASGVAYAITTQRPAGIIAGTLASFGLVAVAAMVARNRLRTVLIAVVAAALLAGGAWVWFVGVPTQAYGAAAAPAAPEITMLEPVDGTESIAGCVTMRFAAKAPDGYTFVAATSTADDQVRYFEGDSVSEPNGTWSIPVVLGEDNRDKGKKYRVEIVMMEKEWASYLSATQLEEGETWWSQRNTPPGSVVAKTFYVRRGASPTGGCAG